MSRIVRREGVDDDIFHEAVWLAERSEDAALRFAPSVEASLNKLAQMPRMGSRKEFGNSALAVVRTWRVRGFRNHLIYYIALEDGIDVLAVMHGAREPAEMLGERSKL
jgi:toxin ParE1/3/4